MEKRPSKGLLAGLWQFPNVPQTLPMDAALDAVKQMGLRPKEILRQVERCHIFTHIRWEMRGIYLEVAEESDACIWLTAEQINEIAALPTAFRQFWEEADHV